jgi:hypothetical protein
MTWPGEGSSGCASTIAGKGRRGGSEATASRHLAACPEHAGRRLCFISWSRRTASMCDNEKPPGRTERAFPQSRVVIDLELARSHKKGRAPLLDLPWPPGNDTEIGRPFLCAASVEG